MAEEGESEDRGANTSQFRLFIPAPLRHRRRVRDNVRPRSPAAHGAGSGNARGRGFDCHEKQPPSQPFGAGSGNARGRGFDPCQVRLLPTENRMRGLFLGFRVAQLICTARRFQVGLTFRHAMWEGRGSLTRSYRSSANRLPWHEKAKPEVRRIP
jgi:hypothetical protein